MVFSPPTDPKVATKVDTIVGDGSGGKGLVFFLDGIDKEKELLRLKAEFRKIRSVNKLPTATTSSSSSSASSSSASSMTSANNKKRSAAQMLVDDHSDSVLRESRLKQRKTNLLLADKHLAKSYKELVETSRIVSEDEFWSLYVDPSLLEDKESQVQRQGRLTITDIIKSSTKQTADGLTSISLNQDDRQSILDSDATARRAYAELVPLQKSEGEFWVLYFEKWINGVSPQADELFAKYDEKNIISSSRGGGAKDSASSRQFQNGCDFDFDLMKNYSDYYSSESFAAEDRVHEMKKDVIQLNNESQRVIIPLRNAHVRSRDDTTKPSTTELTELNGEKVPSYMPLKMKHLELPEEAAEQSVAAAPVVQSAFGKASSTVARGVNKRPPFVPQSANQLIISLSSMFPSGERALVWYNLDRATLKTSTQLVNKSNAVVWSNTYDDFRQEMLEAFTGVTELLRHFFAILNRDGVNAPRKGTEAAGKIAKIVDRLLSRKEQLLMKARALKDSKKFVGRELEASSGVINDIVRLISRASDWWTTYQSRDEG